MNADVKAKVSTKLREYLNSVEEPTRKLNALKNALKKRDVMSFRIPEPYKNSLKDFNDLGLSEQELDNFFNTFQKNYFNNGKVGGKQKTHKKRKTRKGK